MRVMAGVAAAALGALLAAGTARAGEARREAAGTLGDGSAVEAIELVNDHGVTARILTYGATLQSVVTPDRQGRKADVVLGYDRVQDYEAKPNYFGVTVGRYANRIAGGRFELGGQTYQLPKNNGPNSLHGGGQGFDRKLWRVEAVEGGPTPKVVLSLTSPDGEAGYPGALQVRTTYALDNAGALTITMEARTDRSTVVNMTNHAIFNLAGEGAPEGTASHRLTIPASA